MQFSVFPKSGSEYIPGENLYVYLTFPINPNFSGDILVNVSNLNNVTFIEQWQLQRMDTLVGAKVLTFKVDDATSDCSFTLSVGDFSRTISYKKCSDDIDPKTWPVFTSSPYLYDPAPIADHTQPTARQPYVAASINPLTKKGNPIEGKVIIFYVTGLVRLFQDYGSEIQCVRYDYTNGRYYYVLCKDDFDALSVKIYATKGMQQFVSLLVLYGNETYAQKTILFVNTSLIPQSSIFQRPTIAETLGSSTLTRMDNADYWNSPLIARTVSAT